MDNLFQSSYRLSHATTFRTLGLPVQLDIWTSSSYRLSHATVYINYDGYATYTVTITIRNTHRQEWAKDRNEKSDRHSAK